ncbi:hypothetical protein AB7M35_003820 [Amorphus suaedae]
MDVGEAVGSRGIGRATVRDVLHAIDADDHQPAR